MYTLSFCETRTAMKSRRLDERSSAVRVFVDTKDDQLLLAPKITLTDIFELLWRAAMNEAVRGKSVGAIRCIPRRLFPLG